jgi:phosphoglycerate dehydrogenase-like enzyme
VKILIASSIYPAAIEKLQAQHDVICEFDASEQRVRSLIVDREVLILRSGVQITAGVLAAASHLKLIVRAGSGIDNIDLDFLHQTDVQLVRIPGPGAKAVAEMSFALMLALARNVLEADRLLRKGRWAKHELTGYLLTGKVLGIVGTGNIGSRVGQLGVAWGMEVIGCVEHPSEATAHRLREIGIRLTDCNQLLARSDFISIHVPLQPSTRNLIDVQEFALMKPGAYLTNLSRGEVVNESALYQALTEGHLRGAASDVHEHEGEGKISPLAGLKNVIITPHIGAGTFDSQREIGDLVIEAIEALKAEKAETFVNNGRVLIQKRALHSQP